MISPILTTPPWKLVEKQDGRQTYVQYKNDAFVKPLFQVARKLIEAPVITTQHKELYIDAIEAINAHYFAAKDVKEAAQGQFHKYDATAEEQFRETVAEEVSRCVGELHVLFDAHRTIVDVATTRLEKRHGDPKAQRDASFTFEQTIAMCTMKVVCDGWFPTLELYYFSLNPGERVAEGRERREQRLYGTEETQGVADRLAQPGLEQVTQQDITKLKQINTNSSVDGHAVIQKLQTEYDWVVS
jgi:hypothetical protein